MQFGTPMENHMPIAVKWSKSKREVELRYGGRLFSETGSSNVSAVDGDIWSKFCTDTSLLASYNMITENNL